MEACRLEVAASEQELQETKERSMNRQHAEREFSLMHFLVGVWDEDAFLVQVHWLVCGSTTGSRQKRAFLH